MEVAVNYWAVLFAALSSMAVGSIWYSQGAFGKTWAKLAHIKMDKKVSGSQMAVLLGSTFIASLLTAYVLAHVTFLSHKFFGGEFLNTALNTAFWLWLGFTAARVFVHDSFESRPGKLTLMTVSHELVTIVVMALIIGFMGIK